MRKFTIFFTQPFSPESRRPFRFFKSRNRRLSAALTAKSSSTQLAPSFFSSLFFSIFCDLNQTLSRGGLQPPEEHTSKLIREVPEGFYRCLIDFRWCSLKSAGGFPTGLGKFPFGCNNAYCRDGGRGNIIQIVLIRTCSRD